MSRYVKLSRLLTNCFSSFAAWDFICSWLCSVADIFASRSSFICHYHSRHSAHSKIVTCPTTAPQPNHTIKSCLDNLMAMTAVWTTLIDWLIDWLSDWLTACIVLCIVVCELCPCLLLDIHFILLYFYSSIQLYGCKCVNKLSSVTAVPKSTHRHHHHRHHHHHHRHHHHHHHNHHVVCPPMDVAVPTACSMLVESELDDRQSPETNTEWWEMRLNSRSQE